MSHSLTHTFTYSFTNGLIYSNYYFIIISLTYSLIYENIHSIADSLSYYFTNLLAHSFIHLITYQLTYESWGWNLRGPELSWTLSLSTDLFCSPNSLELVSSLHYWPTHYESISRWVIDLITHLTHLCILTSSSLIGSLFNKVIHSLAQ